MNRAMRRELAKREFPKTQATQIKKFTLSEASRVEQKMVDESQLNHAYKTGKVAGMEVMYQLVVKACERVNGIGEKRKHAIKNQILELIMEIGREDLKHEA